MGVGSPDGPISTVLVDESFGTQDERFVGRVRMVSSPKYLAALADRWKKDPRPWAREQVLRYLALPLDRPGHHPLVKRLFKQAEANGDDELMAAFLVAFDRLVRRKRRTRHRYDWQTRQSWQEEELFSPRDQILPASNPREARNPRTGERFTMPGGVRLPKNGTLFSYRTRGYLRRRVCRYFRRVGFKRPTEYPRVVAAALALYRDQDTASGENILDNWSLMCIAFRRSPALKFKRTAIEVADGRSLGELVASPQFDALWKTLESASILLDLLTKSHCRLVRVWAIQMLKRDHSTSLQAIGAEQLLTLLDHPDDEVQQFASGLLATLPGIDAWPITTWLRLLNTKSTAALATICETMSRRVNPERLNVEQCVALACSLATPVARLGLSWLSGRTFAPSQDRAAIVRLADARCSAVGVEVARYALSLIGSAPTYRTEEVSPFFDSLNAGVRQAAWDWLTPDSPGYGDATLWSRLVESPFDDVRLRLVAELDERLPKNYPTGALARQDLSPVWTTVLMGIHRGSRAKLRALRQISEAIAARPDRAEQLVPVLIVAIRSVRPAEARAGLSAILAAVAARPELEAMLERQLPELRLRPTGATQ